MVHSNLKALLRKDVRKFMHHRSIWVWRFFWFVMTIFWAGMTEASTSSALAKDVTGRWLDDTGAGAVEIAPCGTELCGSIIWLQNPRDEAGRPLTDSLNPDRAKQGREVCGLQVIGALKPGGTEGWADGWVYDPKEGATYNLEISLRTEDRLEILGYLAIKLLSRRLIWSRWSGTERCQS